MKLSGPYVGVSAVVVRAGAVLVGLRRGAHGAGTWAFPGGKLDPGEDPRAAVARELEEETGLQALGIEPVSWTSDVFADAGLHFITLHHVVHAEGEVTVREPDKVRPRLRHRQRCPPSRRVRRIRDRVDAAPRLLGVAAEQARARGLVLDLREGDLLALPVPDDAVDVVISLREANEDPSALLVHSPYAVHVLRAVA